MSVVGKEVFYIFLCVCSPLALDPISQVYICCVVLFHLTFILPQQCPSIFKAHKLVQELVLIVVIHVHIVHSNIGVIF